MKESKTLFICAAMKLTADLMKIIVNIGDIYPVKVGWATSLVLSVASVWLIANSKVKHKPILVVVGAVTYIAVGVILATMATFGLVEAP